MFVTIPFFRGILRKIGVQSNVKTYEPKGSFEMERKKLIILLSLISIFKMKIQSGVQV